MRGIYEEKQAELMKKVEQKLEAEQSSKISGLEGKLGKLEEVKEEGKAGEEPIRVKEEAMAIELTIKTAASELKDYMVFDIETTGLSKEKAETIQQSGLKFKNDEIVETFDESIKVGEDSAIY